MADSINIMQAALRRVTAALDELKAFNERHGADSADSPERHRLWQALMDANTEFTAAIDDVLKRGREEEEV
jgi:hypothetical protein